MGNKVLNKFDILVSIMILLTISGIIINAVDMFYYQKFLSNKGISLVSIVPLEVIAEYLTSYPGNLLTTLGIAPWIIILAYLFIPDYIAKLIKTKKL